MAVLVQSMEGGRGRVNGIPGVSEMLADVDALN